MNSCIYEGTVFHARKQPRHQFRYRLFMMFVDLDESNRLFERRWFWSTSLPNLAWFRRKDYLGDPESDLAQCVRDVIEQQMGERPAGAIRLLTNLRYFGFLINPISLYFCYSEQEDLEFVVAEVTNTPWNERQQYVLDLRDTDGRKPICRAAKSLHVSPFMSMDYEYQFVISEPSDQLDVRIENHELGQPGKPPPFVAAMALKKKPINRWSLSGVLVRYPLITIQIAFAIYWQALCLYLKGARFFKHPDKLCPVQVEVESVVSNEPNVRLEELESTIR